MKTMRHMFRDGRWVMLLAAGFALSACTEEAPQALGTLEYDRVTLPAPSAERIVSIAVREGQQVEAGETLLTLERTRSAAQTKPRRPKWSASGKCWANCRQVRAVSRSHRRRLRCPPRRPRRVTPMPRSHA